MDYGKLDDLAAPDKYVAPSTQADIEYIVRFRQTCKRYNINFFTSFWQHNIPAQAVKGERKIIERRDLLDPQTRPSPLFAAEQNLRCAYETLNT